MMDWAKGRRILITGGCGFIGTHLVEHLCGFGANVTVTVFDALTYAAVPASVARVRAAGAKLVQGDVADRAQVAAVFAEGDFDTVFHLAAESHVDRSISDAAPFVRTNVLGTQVMVEQALAHGVTCFVQMSTDEVFGHLGIDDAPFTPSSPYAPRSPYAASKAAGDHLALAAHHTHGLPVIVAHASNCYGPGQHPEKFIPRLIVCGLNRQPMPVYGAGENIRDWLWVKDCAAGLGVIAAKGKAGQHYLLGARSERRNIDVARMVATELDRVCLVRPPHATLIRMVADRKGHDLRYAVDPAAAEALGWKAEMTFETGLAATVRSYVPEAVI